MKEKYLAQGICMNCGYKNYPRWGEYEVGKKVSDYPCPKCNCMTFITDTSTHLVSEPNNPQ